MDWNELERYFTSIGKLSKTFILLMKLFGFSNEFEFNISVAFEKRGIKKLKYQEYQHFHN